VLRRLRPVLAVLARPFRWLRRAILLRRDRLGMGIHVALLLAGIGTALLLALPVDDVTDRCPARGEGYDFCYVQKALVPSILIVLAGGLLAQWIAAMTLVRLPAYVERVREVGERRTGEPEAREDPPYARDPFLLASTWGAKHGPTERRHPRLGDLLARLRRRRLRD
jgi:hypothetical protein